MLFLLVLPLTLLASRCDGEETPAMKLILTDEALRYASRLGGQWLRREIASASIPAVTGSVSIGLRRDVDYVLDGMRARCGRSPEPSAQFDEGGGGLRAALSGLDVLVSGDYRTSWRSIHYHGTFQLSLSNVHVRFGLRLGKDSAGHLTVARSSCSAGIGDLTINLKGQGSLLYEPFVKKHRGRIKSQIEERICPGIERSVQDVQRRLAAMRLSLPVSPGVVVEVPLTSAPRVHSTHLGLDWKGEFYRARNRTEPPFHAKPFTLTPLSDRMVQFGFSEFAVNSASYVYSSSIRAQINDSMIPKTSPVRLNTTSFAMFVPQLAKMFPNMLMELRVDAREVPTFSFVSDSVELDVSAAVKAFAVCPNKTLVPLFELSVDANFSLNVFFSQGKVKGSATMSNVSMALLSSEVGDFQITGLESVVKMALKMVVLTKVNTMLSQGVDIPRFHNIQLVNPVLLVKEGFMVIASDVKM